MVLINAQMFTTCVASTRLKNIEETEKAKRQVAEDRRGGKKEDSVVRKDEEHLAASRCESSNGRIGKLLTLLLLSLSTSFVSTI